MTRGAVTNRHGASDHVRTEPIRSKTNAPAVLLGLAAAALLLAALGALGPAERAAATYSWPPSALPSETPDRLWYTPLVLTRHEAASVSATVPCTPASRLPVAAAPTTVLATAREPRRAGALSIVRTGDRLRFMSGDAVLETAPIPDASPGEQCSFHLEVEGNDWALQVPHGPTERGNLDREPVVTGIFSELDLRAGPRPAIEVTTKPYDVRPTAWQSFAWTASALLALAALLLVAGAASWRLGRRRAAGLLGRPRAAVRPVDGVVALLLATWWIVGPVVFDDGWVKARQGNYAYSGGFSNYYTTFGTNLPLDFWQEWLQHWIIGSFDTLLVLRLPALALLAGAWIVARWTLGQLLEEMEGARTGAEWALGLAFSLNAFAWALTLRPEPGVALLLVGVLACAVRFALSPSAGPLALASVLVALAVTAHPAGLTALAPLLAVAPHVVAWMKERGWVAPIVIAGSAGALALVLFTVSSDLAERLEAAQLVRAEGDATASWRSELSRYAFTGAESTTLRRESVSLMLAAVLAYLLRRDRGRRIDIAGASLLLSLVLLIPTPSKWAWHFGALAGLAAVAVAAEVARLRADSITSRWPVRPLIAVGVTILVIGWSWYPRPDWSSEFGLRTLDWMLGFEQRITLTKLAAALPVLVLGAAAIVVIFRYGMRAVERVPWRIVPWLVPLAVVPLIAFNVIMLVRDAFETPAWTLARQNVESLRDDAGCGLADDTVVAVPGSERPLAALPGTVESLAGSARWVGKLPVAGLSAFSLLHEGATRAETPWYRLPPEGRRVGLFVTSASGPGDLLTVRWAGRQPLGGVSRGRWQAVPTPSLEESSETLPWVLVSQRELQRPPSGAVAVQFAVRSDARPPRALSVTGPISYEAAPLSTILAGENARPLVWPNLLPYMPCAQLPRLARGIVEVPTVLVAHSGFWPVEFETSAFHGILDVYDIRDLSGRDSRVPADGMFVLWIDRRIPGSALAPAEAEPAA